MRLHHRFCVLAALALLSFHGPAICLGQDEDFVPMFNGEDFDGWVLTNTPPETWRFEEDLLICSGKPIGEIRTEKMYQNFIMELEWRHMVPRGNAGIFVWADDIPSRGVPFHRGIEVQVLENAYGDNESHTTHGDIFPIHGATMTPINGKRGMRAFPTEKRSNPSPQWNHYRIECIGGEISLAVNGKVVTRGKHCVPRKGYICLESEGGIVHYRNVRIRELPETEIQPDMVAIANRGYRSLYSGLNLNGWQHTKQDQANQGDGGNWSADDWVLSFQGTSDEAGMLATEETFDKAAFVVDVRFNNDQSSAEIEFGDQMRVDLQDPTIAQRLQPVGKWNRIEASSPGSDQWLEVNGTRVPQALPNESSSGHLTLRPTGEVDFCNLFVSDGDSDQ